jgi:hypothetical protein
MNGCKICDVVNGSPFCWDKRTDQRQTKAFPDFPCNFFNKRQTARFSSLLFTEINLHRICPAKTTFMKRIHFLLGLLLLCSGAAFAQQDPAKKEIQALVTRISREGSVKLTSADRKLMANWLSVNGEAIKGVKPWGKATGEGPSMKDSTATYGPGDFKFAEAKNALYVFVMEVPKQDMRIKSLATSVGGKIIGTVTLLGSKERMSWEQEERELNLELSHTLPQDGPVVFKITWTEYYKENPPDNRIKIIEP